jgi:phosphoribosylaminoimidazole-succinocarboxamide synthase
MSAASEPSGALFESHETDARLLGRGKARDIYELADGDLLIVTSDRISAFDVVLPTPIPGKGVVLNQVSNFWFAQTGHIIANHIVDPDPFADVAGKEHLRGRSVVVRHARSLPIEAIVRGYLAGSGWAEYKRSTTVCGIALPSGLQESSRLREALFTPSTKAEQGAHDENITYDQAAALLGEGLAAQVRDVSLALYSFAAAHARERGIIIADTKFEFGQLDDGTLILIDEALTPDSSRFWPVDGYEAGRSQPSFDKQFVRDYLESIGWGKQPPAPELPQDVVRKTAEKYREAQRRLTGKEEAS